MSSHTPGLLKQDTFKDGSLATWVVDANGVSIADTDVGGSLDETDMDTRIANATEIVRRWNAHEDLMTACRLALQGLDFDLSTRIRAELRSVLLMSIEFATRAP